MKNFAAECFIAFVLCLCLAGTGWAHRVNLFAYPDGDAVQVECYFGKNQKVRHGALTFSDGETGAVLCRGTTDEQGMFRFRPDGQFLVSGHGLDILLYAGEGHQSSWRMGAEELQSLAAAVRPAEECAVSEGSSADLPLAAMDRRELEEIVGKAMDARLAPLVQALARQENREPDLRDVIGGIGWILGLLGLAAYLRYRPRKR